MKSLPRAPHTHGHFCALISPDGTLFAVDTLSLSVAANKISLVRHNFQIMRLNRMTNPISVKFYKGEPLLVNIKHAMFMYAVVE